ncbi:MAG TPA: SGNH/GDSL hydrolase family protein [Chthoniobacterales bacterium]|nr:SGNH/GDSL hydrolase family protein [Chthoniobacterales bacterium]
MEVAILGDSVCTGVYISSPWSTFWRARRARAGNWFVDTTPPARGIQSVCKRLEELTPVVATECAGIGALVDGEVERQNFFRRILRTRDFSGQIRQLLRAPRLPDLILISIGHNNIDWTWRRTARELERPDVILQELSVRFREDFARHLQRLLNVASAQSHRVAIVVYGLVNFESYFKARAVAEQLHAQDRTRYPHLETTYKYFVSFRPLYRSHLVRLARMLNEQLRTIVTDLNCDLAEHRNVQLRYSDALATADLSRIELLHAVDGWHPSAAGHNVLASAAFDDLAPTLEFLGVNSPSTAARH